jgi:HAD hydrolase, family IIA
MGLRDKLLFLLDMDGTIYHENELIDGARDFFDTLNRQGKKYVFMTNNSSKSTKSYVQKLINLGIEATVDNIASSVNVAVLYLKERKPKAKIYLVGTESFKQELQEEKFEVVPVNYREPDIDYVLLGFDTELNYAKIEGACYYVSRGFEYIATNCDMRCPIRENKYIPDCGAIAQFIETATGCKPRFLGKPERAIVDVVSQRFHVPIEKIICVGDRLYTDIAVGINAGADTVCVFSGETQLKDIQNTLFKPTYFFDSIKDLYNAIKD